MNAARWTSFVRETLGNATMSGRELREALRAAGLCKTGPGFYLMMSKMEEAGAVRRITRIETINGERFTTCYYRVALGEDDL